jgi:protein KRI1
MAPPAKKARLLENSSSEESSSEEDGSKNGGQRDSTLRINTDYAKRFEHNKKREELHRCKFPRTVKRAFTHPQ